MAEYFNYSNLFLTENAAKFPKYTRMNNYVIKLEKSKQPPFSPIYSLKLVELETLKTTLRLGWPTALSGLLCLPLRYLFSLIES